MDQAGYETSERAQGTRIAIQLSQPTSRHKKCHGSQNIRLFSPDDSTHDPIKHHMCIKVLNLKKATLTPAKGKIVDDVVREDISLEDTRAQLDLDRSVPVSHRCCNDCGASRRRSDTLHRTTRVSWTQFAAGLLFGVEAHDLGVDSTPYAID